MGELKIRLWHVEHHPSFPRDWFGEETAERIRLESVLLQLRKVLELIAYSALLANGNTLAVFRADLAGMRKARRVLERVGKANPNFFPVPAAIVSSQSQGPGLPTAHRIEFPEKTDAFRHDEFAPLFDACSEALHIRNPLAGDDPIVLGRPVKEWAARIRSLLAFHMIQLSDRERGFVNMGRWDNGTAHWIQVEAEPIFPSDTA